MKQLASWVYNSGSGGGPWGKYVNHSGLRSKNMQISQEPESGLSYIHDVVSWDRIALEGRHWNQIPREFYENRFPATDFTVSVLRRKWDWTEGGFYDPAFTSINYWDSRYGWIPKRVLPLGDWHYKYFVREWKRGNRRQR